MIQRMTKPRCCHGPTTLRKAYLIRPGREKFFLTATSFLDNIFLVPALLRGNESFYTRRRGLNQTAGSTGLIRRMSNPRSSCTKRSSSGGHPVIAMMTGYWPSDR